MSSYGSAYSTIECLEKLKENMKVLKTLNLELKETLNQTNFACHNKKIPVLSHSYDLTNTLKNNKTRFQQQLSAPSIIYGLTHQDKKIKLKR
jgi:hypothetical protein